jgi:hypothetical protein
MKHLLIITCIAAVTGFSVMAQEMKPYKIDEQFSLDLPEAVEKKTDALGQTFYTVFTDYGLVVISATPLGQTAISTEENLKQSYVGFRNGSIKASAGKLISENLFKRNGLTWGKFSYFAHAQNEDQIRYVEVILLKQKIYAVQLWLLKENDELYLKEREALFASIRTPDNATLQDQITGSENNPAGEDSSVSIIAELITTLVIFGIIGLIVYGIVSKVRKETRKQQDNQQF